MKFKSNVMTILGFSVCVLAFQNCKMDPNSFACADNSSGGTTCSGQVVIQTLPPERLALGKFPFNRISSLGFTESGGLRPSDMPNGYGVDVEIDPIDRALRVKSSATYAGQPEVMCENVFGETEYEQLIDALGEASIVAPPINIAIADASSLLLNVNLVGGLTDALTFPLAENAASFPNIQNGDLLLDLLEQWARQECVSPVVDPPAPTPIPDPAPTSSPLPPVRS